MLVPCSLFEAMEDVKIVNLALIHTLGLYPLDSAWTPSSAIPLFCRLTYSHQVEGHTTAYERRPISFPNPILPF